MAKDFVWDQDHPLARQKGERRNAWEAFRDYVRMGPGRSLPKLARGYRGEYTQTEDPLYYGFFKDYRRNADGAAAVIPPTGAQRTLEKWSSVYAWQARLDRHLTMLEEQRAERLREQRADLELNDYRDGQLLRERTQAMIDTMDKFLTTHVEESEAVDDEGNKVITKTVFLEMEPSITQAAAALKTASDLQRLAAGVSTSNQRLVDDKGNDVTPAVIGIEVVKPAPPPDSQESDA